MTRVDVGVDFYHRLANRDRRQGDGRNNAVQFREKYLLELDTPNAWKNDDPYIVLDFLNVKVIGPSFANEAFGYFTMYAKPERIVKKILFENITFVDKILIDKEIKAGYMR